MQSTLFDWLESQEAKRAETPPANATVSPVDEPRLSGQNGVVLARLEQGPATGPELMRIMGSMNPSARISDVRAWLQRQGKTIRSKRIEGGVWEYRIERIQQNGT